MSAATVVGLVLSFIACFILLVIAPFKLTAESADVDMTVIRVRLTAGVTSRVLLPHVPDRQVVTQHVSHGDCAHRVAITPERRGDGDVVVQPVDGPAEW